MVRNGEGKPDGCRVQGFVKSESRSGTSHKPNTPHGKFETGDDTEGRRQGPGEGFFLFRTIGDGNGAVVAVGAYLFSIRMAFISKLEIA
jgi:hypothetical protein